MPENERFLCGVESDFQSRLEAWSSIVQCFFGASLLESLSPLAVLHRGFSLNQKEDGSLLKSVEDVETGEAVEIRLEDGELKTKVLEKKKKFQKN